MEPPDRTKRILFAFGAAAVSLGFMGIFFWPILKELARADRNGGPHSHVPLLLFGGFFLLMALAVVGTVWRGIRKLSKAEVAVPATREAKPWLARPDWAAGKIKAAGSGQTKIMAVMALAFCGMGGLFTFLVLPKELRHHNYPALLGLLFPAVGLGLLVAVLRRGQARRRFGDCYFELAAIPGAIGGTLEGLIQTGTRLELEHGLHLKLSCLRRTVSGSGDNRSVREDMLWEDEKVFKSQAALPEPEPGRSGIPVFFKIPADQPECFARGSEAVVWRLEARAKMTGPDFSAAFEVPVFQLAGALPAQTEARDPDPTAALQMPVEELRRDERSKIQVTEGPGGREFYFPAARNLGLTLGLTAFFLVWSGIFWVLVRSHAPLLFPIVWGVTDALVGFGCVNLWFRSSRVTINATGVTAVNRWLVFSRTRRFDAGAVARFDLAPGMTSGRQTFHDLKLFSRADADSFAARKARYGQSGQLPPLKLAVSTPRGFTLASSIASKPEADWLVREMTRALGRKI